MSGLRWLWPVAVGSWAVCVSARGNPTSVGCFLCSVACGPVDGRLGSLISVKRSNEEVDGLFLYSLRLHLSLLTLTN